MRITNVVVQGELGCTFDLRELTHRLVNVRFDPRSFSGLIWQHCKIGGNCLLFSNGKINCNGKCLSLRDSRRRLRRYARCLQKMVYEVRLSNVRLVTVSAVHQLSGRIDPSRLPKDFSCEPELFPAAMVRRHGLHFMCHLSGKTMITGIIRVSDLDYFYTILLEFELYL
jgi:TATA-box binding protein (TBP) (component of TFIID and TFIIIB)